MTTEVQSGTQTATLTTRHQLGSAITAAGSYVLHVDTTNLANGEELLLEIEIKTRTGSTSRITEQARFKSAQTVPVKRSVPVAVAHEIKFFLSQTGGTGRSFDWSVVSL